MNWIAGYKQHYKALIFLGLPIVIGQVGVIILGFADTLMIGHHSTEELGAASFVNNVFTLCIIFSTGFSYGLTPIVGSLYGNRRFAEAGQALRCSLVANVLVALLLTFIMTVVYFNVERLGQPEELMPLIKPYYLVLLASLVFVMLFNGFKQFTDGITDTKTAMWILLQVCIIYGISNFFNKIKKCVLFLCNIIYIKIHFKLTFFKYLSFYIPTSTILIIYLIIYYLNQIHKISVTP